MCVCLSHLAVTSLPQLSVPPPQLLSSMTDRPTPCPATTAKAKNLGDVSRIYLRTTMHQGAPLQPRPHTALVPTYQKSTLVGDSASPSRCLLTSFSVKMTGIWLDNRQSDQQPSSTMTLECRLDCTAYLA